MKKKLFLASIVLSYVFLSSCSNCCDVKCGSEDEAQIIEENDTINIAANVEEHKDCEHVHWSNHKGTDGPEHWKDLCDGFYECGGTAQSPINIVTAEVVDAKGLSAPIFNYDKSKVDIVNNEHTVQFNITGENSINLDGNEYKLLQFHYHTNSEHTVDGNYYPIELHFVHRHSDEDYAVLGVLFEEGEENELFAKYLDKFPPTKGEYKDEDINMIKILDIFPENKSYYTYKGSLTTPPCSEVVNWIIFKTPITASKEQIAKLSEILDNNYRPVLPTNDREVKLYSE